MNIKLYQNGTFYRLYFLSGFWCFELHVSDLWFIMSVKALNKNTALCHSVGNRIFFPISACRVPRTRWIYFSSNYEIWGYRAINDCHHMPLKLLPDGTMNWVEIPFCWRHHTFECTGRKEHRRLSFSLRGRGFQISSRYNRVRFFGLRNPSFLHRLISHMLISIMWSKRVVAKVGCMHSRGL